jgi:hypothetical protein
VSKEVVGELHRQFWTTYNNLEQWFESWVNTLATLEFKTKLSLDGSDGIFGG